MLRSFGLITFLVSLAFGCTSVDLAPDSEQRVKQIGFKEDVIVNARPYRGGGIYSYHYLPIAAYMREHGIDIGSIVFEEFKSQVVTHPKFRDKSFDPSKERQDATFELEVSQWGIHGVHGAATDYAPNLQVTARLVTPDGQRLWEATGNLLGACVLPGVCPSVVVRHHATDYFKDPKVMEDAFQKAAERVVGQLMESL